MVAVVVIEFSSMRCQPLRRALYKWRSKWKFHNLKVWIIIFLHFASMSINIVKISINKAFGFFWQH
ncbi:hypothetical protein FXE85_09950 [Vibrio cholerae]|nr:hypothetical protein FXE85_09950 [Vibrio cholerae]